MRRRHSSRFRNPTGIVVAVALLYAVASHSHAQVRDPYREARLRMVVADIRPSVADRLRRLVFTLAVVVFLIVLAFGFLDREQRHHHLRGAPA